MVDGGQVNLALLMVGGAWVEGMYLTMAVSESGAHVSGFESVLLEQKKSFETLEELATPHTDDALVSKMLADMKPIKDMYATLGTSLTMQNVEDLKKAVSTVRTELIK
jgi:hypothetical protein